MTRIEHLFENALKAVIEKKDYKTWFDEEDARQQLSFMETDISTIIWQIAMYTHYTYCDGKSRFPIYRFTMLNTGDKNTENLMKNRLYSYLDPNCGNCVYCLGGKCRVRYMYNGKCVGGDRDIPDEDNTVCQLWELDD